MARTVTDAAIMLGALEGAAPDPNDAATRECPPPPGRDYTRFLKPGGTQGRAHRHSARVLLRRVASPGDARRRAADSTDRAAQDDGRRDRRAQSAGRRDRRSGRHPERRRPDPAKNFLNWNPCSGAEQAKGRDADCSVVLQVRHEARLQRVAGQRSGQRRR